MNYSQSTEDYRQFSVDYSDSNSISESTSLILSNRGHKGGKIFIKDYVCELCIHLFCPLKCGTDHVPGDRHSLAACGYVTWEVYLC